MRALDLELAPEACRGGLTQASVNFEFVSEDRGPLIVDLSAHHHGIDRGSGHPVPVHPELYGKQRAGRLDEAKVGNVVDDSTRIGVEEHDLNRGNDGGGRRHGRMKLES